MAGFGGLGGMGGASFPTRFGMPDNTAVGYLGDAQTWQNDWQSRYNAEEARRRAASTVSGPSREQYIRQQLGGNFKPQGPVAWQGAKDVNEFVDHFNGDGQFYYGDRATGEQVGRHALGNALYDKLANYQPTTRTVAGYTPDFTDLNAEKARLTPLYEAQTRNAEAYQTTLGNGQVGGVIGPGYELPDFGQITGDFGQTGMGQNGLPGANAGVDMSWSNGAYSPGQGQAAGVYAPNPYNTVRWGL